MPFNYISKPVSQASLYRYICSVKKYENYIKIYLWVYELHPVHILGLFYVWVFIGYDMNYLNFTRFCFQVCLTIYMLYASGYFGDILNGCFKVQWAFFFIYPPIKPDYCNDYMDLHFLKRRIKHCCPPIQAKLCMPQKLLLDVWLQLHSYLLLWKTNWLGWKPGERQTWKTDTNEQTKEGRAKIMSEKLTLLFC